MSARPRLLIVKTSSLGDVVHALPAISDIAGARPGWEIDWICEDAFADIPALHAGVGRVIPCSIRKWRRSWWSRQTRREVADFRQAARATAYDVVLDLQGLLKSAWIVRQAVGERHGYAWDSAREPLATIAYDVRHRVAWNQHAITRNRMLAAAALGYAVEGEPRYGVTAPAPDVPDGPPYVVALHATSRADKLWPEADWRRLLAAVSARRMRIVLPWGTPAERARAEGLAAGLPGAEVPARMSPRELAVLFAGARAVVGVDTGLVHLAVAVGTPALALFGPTDPALTGVWAERSPAINLGGNGTAPNCDQVLDAVSRLLDGTATGGPPRSVSP